MEVYSVLKSELLNDPAFEFTDDSRQWVERVFTYLSLPLSMYVCISFLIYVFICTFGELLCINFA